MCRLLARNVFRILSVIFNLAILILSFVLLVFASIYINNNKLVYDKHLYAISIYALLISLCLPVVFIYGCVCGLYRLIEMCIRRYAYMLFFFTVINIVLGITACFLATVGDTSDVINYVEKLYDSFSTGNQQQRKDIDNIQNKYQCCGTGGTSNWTQPLPESCCDVKPCVVENIYKDSCPKKVVETYKSYKITLAAIAVTLAALTCLTGMMVLYLIKFLPEFMVVPRPH